MIGDAITDGGTQLLWPFSMEWIKYGYTIMMTSRFEVYMELALFAVLFLTMSFSGDLREFLSPNGSNRLLFIPLATIVLPAMFRYPMGIPGALIPPHLILLGIVGLSFTLSMLEPLHITGEGNKTDASRVEDDE